ncbi:MAG: GntR family transcriptional regulator [Vallitaleaceae bacterium]|jgi:K+/H+ antiporter YhaU regulatory subunit KhtT|nr:GntR family transcriptional regulator [Vallitaleaceae bacterium]
MAKKNTTPIYLQIAVDVAGRISSEELIIGQRFSGRTTLAGEYNVSPETIRKAMKLLSDAYIVEVKPGNGIHVSSTQRAKEFIERYRIRASVNELKEELLDLKIQRDDIEIKMNETMNAIIDYTSRFKSSDYISVNKYFLDYDSLSNEKTLKELDLKHNTGITLVGIKREGMTILSPEEDELIKAMDVLLYIGNPSSSIRLDEYLQTI